MSPLQIYALVTIAVLLAALVLTVALAIRENPHAER